MLKSIIDRTDTRSIISLSLVCSMVALTFVLAITRPDSDAFKVLLGAMLTVGFAGIIGWYYNSTEGSRGKDATINALTTPAVPPTVPIQPSPQS